MQAVIYARYSSDNQSEESITAQIRACTDYANKNGYDIAETYIDRAQSARSADRREFQRMIADSANRLFQAVIVHKLDRFSRDRYDHAFFKRELRKNGVRVLSVLEHLDDSPESVMLESLLEGVSEYFSRNLSRETKKGLKETALQSKFTGGNPPFGFSLDTSKRYIVNEREAAAVRRIFKACLDGVGYVRLAEVLNDEGYRTRFNKPFTKTSFNEMLKNEKYIGTYTYKLGEEVIRQENAIPAIVDRKTFWEVQDIMTSRKRVGRFKAVEPYLLSGILFCGECGAPMSGHRRHQHGSYYYSYECNQNTRSKLCGMCSVSRDKLEKIIIDFVQSLYSEKALSEIEVFMQKHMSLINSVEGENLAELDAEIARVDRQLDRAIDMALDMPTERLKKRTVELETRLKQLQRERDKLEDTALNDVKLSDYIGRIENIDGMTRGEKQIFVRKMIKKVTAYEDGHLDVLTAISDAVDKIGGATRI